MDTCAFTHIWTCRTLPDTDMCGTEFQVLRFRSPWLDYESKYVGHICVCCLFPRGTTVAMMDVSVARASLIRSKTWLWGSKWNNQFQVGWAWLECSAAHHIPKSSAIWELYWIEACQAHWQTWEKLLTINSQSSHYCCVIFWDPEAKRGVTHHVNWEMNGIPPGAVCPKYTTVQLRQGNPDKQLCSIDILEAGSAEKTTFWSFKSRALCSTFHVM